MRQQIWERTALACRWLESTMQVHSASHGRDPWHLTTSPQEPPTYRYRSGNWENTQTFSLG